MLLDLNIPKVSGLEVLRRLRTGSNCRQTPVIIVSSSQADEDRRLAYEFGADAYFQKPTDLASYGGLKPLVRRLLG